MPGVVVLGSINRDLVAEVDRFPRPGETVAGHALEQFPGGKGANQAVAAARLGAVVRMIGATGADEAGHAMLAFLRENAVDVSGVSVRGDTATGTALVTVAAGENSIVVIPGANATVSESEAERLDTAPGDILLCQLELPIRAVAAALERASRRGAVVVLNAAPASIEARALLGACHVLLVNESELATLAGATLDASTPAPVLAQAIDRLRARPDQTVIATLGARGALVSTPSIWFEIAGHAVRAIDTTGAGDCFAGALAAALARGRSMHEAAGFATAAAALSVQRPGAGTSMPTRAEVEGWLSGQSATSRSPGPASPDSRRS